VGWSLLFNWASKHLSFTLAK